MTSTRVKIIKHITGSLLIFSRLHVLAPIASVIRPYAENISHLSVNFLPEKILINFIDNSFTNSNV